MLTCFQRSTLVCLFLLSFFFSLFLGHLTIKPAVANDIPTLVQDYYGYQVLVPDWSRIAWSNLPAVTQSGSISIPKNLIKALGYNPSRSWVAGQSPDTIVMLGDIGSATGLQKLALQQVQEITDRFLD